MAAAGVVGAAVAAHAAATAVKRVAAKRADADANS
jgi:hydrogenase small subunit